MNEDALCRDVRRIGQTLLAELRGAEQETRAWSDADLAISEVGRIMSATMAELAATQCWGEANRLPSASLWQVAGTVLSVGWLQQHARSKPRGYAGDFEMLGKIIDKTLCSHPLGRAFDHFFQEQAAPGAVRARTRLIAERIAGLVRESANPTVRVCSVGSGPAIDVEWACRELMPQELNKLAVTLVDLDPDALAHAEHRLSRVLHRSQLRVHRENLFRLPRLSRTEGLLGGADFVSCTGLFDYLADSDAVAMLNCFWRHLAPGGELIAFNFSPSNPSRAYMEWIGNWYLTYRDGQAMASLAREAVGTLPHITVGSEATGVDLYVACRKG
ncbi:MAG: class I SAM-dependent methyltransferase [Thermoguttaceae bacterium]|jgi:SAM-dependent methyltransferase|nr:class I SAM-dependent methyltransferase [Thermoguttaceae bacterium]